MAVIKVNGIVDKNVKAIKNVNTCTIYLVDKVNGDLLTINEHSNCPDILMDDVFKIIHVSNQTNPNNLGLFDTFTVIETDL